jgi:hypothetical protein
MNDYHHQPKLICCKCGCRMVECDGHFICEKYLEDIKMGIKQQQEIIDELNSGELI